MFGLQFVQSVFQVFLKVLVCADLTRSPSLCPGEVGVVLSTLKCAQKGRLFADRPLMLMSYYVGGGT